MYLNTLKLKLTYGHGKCWDVVIDIQEVDPEAANCGSYLWPKTSLVISNHCQLHTQKLEDLAFMQCKPIPQARASFLAIQIYTSMLSF